jgi:tRNA(fMet)-specific endonuclease VapC
MLDTNMVSFLLKEGSPVFRRIANLPLERLCISAVTKGEMIFGVRQRPQATWLKLAVEEFLRRVDVLSWDGSVAEEYGSLRAKLELRGTRLADLDLMIASHAVQANAVLVTNDRSFRFVTGLETEDWTKIS